jgi:hypothetical protein
MVDHTQPSLDTPFLLVNEFWGKAKPPDPKEREKCGLVKLHESLFARKLEKRWYLKISYIMPDHSAFAFCDPHVCRYLVLRCPTR